MHICFGYRRSDQICTFIYFIIEDLNIIHYNYIFDTVRVIVLSIPKLLHSCNPVQLNFNKELIDNPLGNYEHKVKDLS